MFYCECVLLWGSCILSYGNPGWLTEPRNRNVVQQVFADSMLLSFFGISGPALVYFCIYITPVLIFHVLS